MSESPLYGERQPPQGGFRRSFTTPARSLSIHEKAGLDKTDAGADVLYTHPTARVFSFSPPTDSIKSTSNAEIPPDTDYPIDAVETLPWRSRTETLSASGVMIIEKVRGSTNFLKCQSVTQAILRNSQCWCVDGESKFVLRVRKFQYYRIELPSTTEEDKAKVEELKKVFNTVMRYERTPCPFIRAFTVDLPDDAITPRRKGAWKRRDSSLSKTLDTDTPPLRRTKNEKSWSPRTPPSSYPRGAPGSATDGERGRSSGPAAGYRRSSLFEDYRNSSPSNHTVSDDGTDSEQHGSEHDSEAVSETDRSNTGSPQKQLRSTKLQERSVSHLIKDRENEIQSGRTAAAQDASKTLRSNQRTTDFTKADSVSIERSVGAAKQAGQQYANQEEMLDSKVDTEVPIVTSAEVARGTAQARAPHHEVQEASIAESAHRSDVDGNSTAWPTIVAKKEYDTTSFKPDNSETEASHHRTVEPAVDSSSSSGESSTSEDDEELQRAEEPPSTIVEIAVQNVQPIVDLDRTSSTSTGSSYESTSESESESESQPESESGSDSESASNQSASIQQQPQSHQQQEEQISALLLHREEPDLQKSMHSAEVESEAHSNDDDNRGLEKTTELDLVVEKDSFTETVSKPRLSPLSTATSTAIEQEQQPHPNEISLQPTSHRESDMYDDSDDVNHDELSPVSSVDSFHTLASISESVSFDDQPSSAEELSTEQRGRPSQAKLQHRRELSEVTVTASSVSESASPEQIIVPRPDYETANPPSLHHSSASDASWPEPATPSMAYDHEGLRQRANGPRSFSPMPPASTIFTGNQIRHDSGSGHMTKAILQKIVVKPIELAVLVVHILVRIAGGATVNDLLSGELFKRPEHRQNVSGVAGQATRGRGGSDTEDDYGVPIRGRKRNPGKKTISTIFDAGDEDDLEDVD